MGILINLLLALLVIVCFLLIFVVLLQRPKSEGLGAAFGGGITDQYLGARQTDIFVRFTTWMSGLFFLLSALLAYLYAHQNRGQTATERALRNAPAPSAQVSPAVMPTPTANNPAASVAAPVVATPPVPATPAAPAAPTPESASAPPAGMASPAVEAVVPVPTPEASPTPTQP